MNQFDVVDLFAGAGGTSMGAKALGLESLGFEIDNACVATRHLAGLHTVQDDVCDLDPVDPRWAQIPGFAASPPCQSFSIGGRGDGRKHIDRICAVVRECKFPLEGVDENTKLIVEPLRWIVTRYLTENPYRWIAFEQVPLVLPIWEAYAEVLRELGYSVSTGLLRAEDFGVPQIRLRAILVARLEGEVRLPLPEVRHHTGFAEALGLEGDWSLVSNYSSEAHRGERAVKHSPAPSWTLTGRCTRMHLAQGHIQRVRSMKSVDGNPLTVSQCGVLQDFSIDYPWYGSRSEVALQVGNAVPPGMATAVLRQAICADLESGNNLVTTRPIRV